MRRWACIITLLAGFTRTDYVWAARVPRPTPIARTLTADRGAAARHALPGTAWWIRT